MEIAAKFRNTRRAALAQLKLIRDRLDYARNRFEVSGTVYYSEPGQYEGSDGVMRPMSLGKTRKRRADEYPENQSAAWAAMYHMAEQAEKLAHELKLFAYEEYLKTQAAENSNV